MKLGEQALGVLLWASWEAFEGCGGLLEGSETALGRLLGGSGQALGRLLEASKRHLGPKTVIARICRRFLKKNEILGSHLGDVLISKIVFLGIPRGFPKRS